MVFKHHVEYGFAVFFTCPDLRETQVGPLISRNDKIVSLVGDVLGQPVSAAVVAEAVLVPVPMPVGDGKADAESIKLILVQLVDKVTAVIINQNHTAAIATIIAIVQIRGIGHAVQDQVFIAGAAGLKTDGHDFRAQMAAFDADLMQKTENLRIIVIIPRFAKIVLGDDDRVGGGVVIIRRILIDQQVIFRHTVNKILPVKKSVQIEPVGAGAQRADVFRGKQNGRRKNAFVINDPVLRLERIRGILPNEP